MSKHRRKYPVCTNCDFQFTQEQPDNYCPQCGQENHDLNVPFQHVALELLEGTVHYDTKFWTTVKYLLFYPGKLTNEFHRGRRMAYVPPIRLYVFISFVFFFLLSWQVGHTPEGETTVSAEIKKPFQVSALDSLSPEVGQQVRDSLAARVARTQQEQILTAEDSLAEEIDVDQLDSLENFPQHATVAQLDSGLTALGIESHNWFTRGALQKIANLNRLTRNELTLKALKYLSVMMFVLMPVFALLLKLVFFRARRYYMEHLMFSIHLHSFFFMLFIVYMLLQFLHLPVDLWGWFNLLGLVYLYLGLKRVFRRSYVRTFFNMFMVLLLYMVVGWATLLLGLAVSVLF